MKNYHFNPLQGLRYGRKTLRLSVLLFVALLVSACELIKEPDVKMLSEASSERQRIAALERWDLVFFIKTRGLLGDEGDFIAETTWVQEKQDFRIKISPKNTFIKTRRLKMV